MQMVFRTLLPTLKGLEELIKVLHTLRRCICNKLGYDENWHFYQMYHAGLVGLQLPVLGFWESDATLSEYCGPKRRMLLALLRPREDFSRLNATNLRASSPASVSVVSVTSMARSIS